MNLQTRGWRTIETFNPYDVATKNGDSIGLTDTIKSAINDQWSGLGGIDSVQLQFNAIGQQINIYFDWNIYQPEKWVNLTHIPDEWKPLIGKRFKVYDHSRRS